jgi:hypothetical protein
MRGQKLDDILAKTSEFEALCSDIFRNLGLTVEKNSRNTSYGLDLILSNNRGKKVGTEIKFYRTRKPTRIMIEKAIIKLKESTDKYQLDNLILIIGMPLEVELKNKFKLLHNIIILDSNNLLYLIDDNEHLKNKLINFLYDLPDHLYVENQPEKIDIDLLFNSVSKTLLSTSKGISKGLILSRELKRIRPGRESFIQYEAKCEEILRYLFNENLNGWNKQLRTDDDLNRYDLVCRVKKGNEFWEFLIDEFHSRYIVFEFKNYTNKVKQTQIYTTEKYLFQKALRNVCFMISRKGLDKNALTSTKGILRESGKLIINISDKELHKLIQLKEAGDEPSDFLFELVDDTLLKLSK